MSTHDSTTPRGSMTALCEAREAVAVYFHIETSRTDPTYPGKGKAWCELDEWTKRAHLNAVRALHPHWFPAGLV